MNPQELSQQVNQAFEGMRSEFGLNFVGLQERNLEWLSRGIRFNSSVFTKEVRANGLDLGYQDEVPSEVRSKTGIAFRAEVRRDPKRPDQYLAIMWETMKKGSANEYLATYATNDQEYVMVHNDIVWEK